MIYKIVGTTFSRGLIAIIGLCTLLLNTKFLGAEKLGELAIYLIILNLVIQVSEFVGGPSLVYLQTKYSKKQLLGISYFWSITVGLISFCILQVFPFDKEVPLFTLAVSFTLQSINHVHLHFLVGKEKIGQYNLTALSFSMALFAGLFWYYTTTNDIQLATFFSIYSIGQFIMVCISSWFVFKTKDKHDKTRNTAELWKETFNYGAIIQTTNLLQFGVYRLNYLILESFSSLTSLGVYSLVNQLSEKALIPGNAISTVQYSSIANTREKQTAITLTFRLITLSLMITIGSCAILLAVPESWIATIFGGEFEPIKSLFWYLIPGLIFMSISTIYSHYFAGLGLYKYNLQVSAVGLIISIGACFLIIPSYGMMGAAIAASLVFAIQTIYQAILFKKEINIPWPDILAHHIQSVHFYLQKLKSVL